MRKHLLHSFLFFSVILLSACSVVELSQRGTVDKASGDVMLTGITEAVTISRDGFGVPRIDAHNESDLAFGLGYAMASDRLAQMVSYSLTAQGRLSEMTGPVTRDLDIYMRTLGLRRISEKQLAAASPKMRRTLDRFAAGVNAWIFSHKDNLPLDFKMNGYQPEPWAPVNSMDIFTLLNLGLSLNLNEEIAFLDLAARVGPEKAAWLIPTYPDEPIAKDEAAKLAGLPFNELLDTLAPQVQVQKKLAALFLPLQQAASNNWVISPERTHGHASILANDTHLQLEQPPVWMLVQLNSPDYQAGGVAIAGIPGVVAGYNGHVAWGMTMVMADSQDVFVEKLKQEDEKTFYLYKDKWLPVQQREEVLHIKGQPDESFLVQETSHGPLLNTALRGQRVNDIMPPVLNARAQWGLALQSSAQQADQSMERLLLLNRAGGIAEAEQALEGVGFIHLNVVLADAQNIAWQVTGTYPQRLKGRGYLPSPGWTGAYDWKGYVPFEQLPHEVNPERGYIATANHRTTAPGSTPYLTGSWYAPERFERISERLEEHSEHTLETTVELQNDVHDKAADKLRDVLKKLEPAIRGHLASAAPEARISGENALKMLSRFDGDMNTDSAGAALYAIFLNRLTRDVFLDELGPVESSTWQSFMLANAITYSAQQDHMLGREDSPFWDDVRTPEHKEDKAEIFALALANAWQQASSMMGADAGSWKWGDIHTYTWESGATRMKPLLPFAQRQAVSALSGFLDRGPYPAPGSTNTVNVTGYTIGDNFKVWNIPAMRMVVDFSLPEPLYIVNAGGQSGNPASPHYADGIGLYLSGRNRRMSFHDAALVDQQFSEKLQLKPLQ
ncbi:MAG: penicillin acylase family protein [bacterium]|nr:penicillin acylase family protein [bacterium]